MLTDYCSDALALARHRGTALGKHLDGFTEWLAKQDYRHELVYLYVLTVTALAEWLPRSLSSKTLDEHVLDRYREHLQRTGRLRSPSGRLRAWLCGARLFLKYLRASGLAPAAPTRYSPLVAEFGEWLRVHRGAVPSTVDGYSKYAQRLLLEIGDPRRATATKIREGLLRQAEDRGRSYVKNLTSAIRSLLRFLIAKGWCPIGLDAAVPMIARWRLAELPQYLTRSDVRRLIAATDRRTPRGLRDYAVLVVLADMGLRAGDIGQIAVNDIDWSGGTISVVGKGKIAARLPMPLSVTRAIRTYVDRGRPDVDRKALFLETLAPYRPVSSGCAYSIVRKAIRRAGIKAPHEGPHVLRHSFAAHMLRRGASLIEIGARLRHRSLDATLTYAKVDATRLQRLAIPWREVASC